jgi:type II secretion system protein I
MNLRSRQPRRPRHDAAFTLLEVMFAVVVFATSTMAILALVSQSLDNARRLQRPPIYAEMLASQFCLTNQLLEGEQSGDMTQWLGDPGKGYNWDAVIAEEQSNKLFRVDIVIMKDNNKDPISKASILLFSPQSPAGTLDGATGPR